MRDERERAIARVWHGSPGGALTAMGGGQLKRPEISPCQKLALVGFCCWLYLLLSLSYMYVSRRVAKDSFSPSLFRLCYELGPGF